MLWKNDINNKRDLTATAVNLGEKYDIEQFWQNCIFLKKTEPSCGTASILTLFLTGMCQNELFYLFISFQWCQNISYQIIHFSLFFAFDFLWVNCSYELCPELCPVDSFTRVSFLTQGDDLMIALLVLIVLVRVKRALFSFHVVC